MVWECYTFFIEKTKLVPPTCQMQKECEWLTHVDKNIRFVPAQEVNGIVQETIFNLQFVCIYYTHLVPLAIFKECLVCKYTWL